MTINNLLCKHFHHRDKGHVTLGDVAKVAVPLLVGAACVSGISIATAYMYFRGASLVTQLEYGELVTGDDMVCITMFVVINMVIIVAVATAVAHKLSSIRVATCMRKDNNHD